MISATRTFQRVLQKPKYAKILVFGVGDAGNNAVSRLMKMGVLGAKCIAVNTDEYYLNAVRAHKRILIGKRITRGFGTGGDPDLGKVAVKESGRKIEGILDGVDVAFIAAGMGGGTGTGAAPIIADMARKHRALVVGVVTMPSKHERGRLSIAARGLKKMRQSCDTVIVIDNNKLMQYIPQLPIKTIFNIADDVSANVIRGIAETISLPSLINIDFGDFRTIVRRRGVAFVGIGESNTQNRAEEAVYNALQCPLLNIDCEAVDSAIVHVRGDESMTLAEASRCVDILMEMMKKDTLVTWGASVDPGLSGFLDITLVLKGTHSSQLLSEYGMEDMEIFDLEPGCGPDQPLDINFGLFQLEGN